jgi:hypothetical protein
MAGGSIRKLSWRVALGDPLSDGSRSRLGITAELEKKSGKVRIYENSDKEQRVLHPPRIGSKDREGLEQDFCFDWKFRSSVDTPTDLLEYEVKQIGTADTWWPAILEREMNGAFLVRVFQPKDDPECGLDQMYQHWETMERSETVYPAYGKLDEDGSYDTIREKATHNLLRPGMMTVRLWCSKDNPFDTCQLSLFVNDGEEQFLGVLLGRPTPAPNSSGALKEVTLEIDKDRERVVSSVGFDTFARYVDNRISWVKQMHEKNKAQWIFRIGLAEHTVTVEKKSSPKFGMPESASTKIITVIVDGSLLIEATPDDMAAVYGHGKDDPKRFTCTFTFRGKRVVNFKLWKVNRDGATCGREPALTRTEFPTETRLEITVPNISDFGDANIAFFEGGVSHRASQRERHWRTLDEWQDCKDSHPLECSPSMIEEHHCRHLRMSRRAFNNGMAERDFKIPWVIDEGAVHGMHALYQQLTGTLGDDTGPSGGGGSGLFGMLMSMFSCGAQNCRSSCRGCSEDAAGFATVEVFNPTNAQAPGFTNGQQVIGSSVTESSPVGSPPTG